MGINKVRCTLATYQRRGSYVTNHPSLLKAATYLENIETTT
jgi:hypothetical protein